MSFLTLTFQPVYTSNSCQSQIHHLLLEKEEDTNWFSSTCKKNVYVLHPWLFSCPFATHIQAVPRAAQLLICPTLTLQQHLLCASELLFLVSLTPGSCQASCPHSHSNDGPLPEFSSTVGWGSRPSVWNSFAICFHSIALAHFAPFLTLLFKFLHHQASGRPWHAVAPICALQILSLLLRTLSLPSPLPNSCSPLRCLCSDTSSPQDSYHPTSAEWISFCVLLYACPSALLYHCCIHYFTLKMPLLFIILETVHSLSVSFCPMFACSPVPDRWQVLNECLFSKWIIPHSF